MKTIRHTFHIVSLIVLAGSFASAGPTPTMADPKLADARLFLKNGQTNEAIWAFRQAAKTGNREALFYTGDLLLEQAKNASGREKIQKSFESVYFLFCAATNRHARACADLSKAFQAGICVQTNFVMAYAWLKLAAEYDPSYKTDLDQLVLGLNLDEVEQAQLCANEWRQGRWPACAILPVTVEDARLKIQGVTISQRGVLVVVNGSTFGQGDTNQISPAADAKHVSADKLTATCLEIGGDYVLLAVAGEPSLRLLPIAASTHN